MRLLAAMLAMILLAGCADERTRQFNRAEIESPLTERQARQYAHGLALQVGGYVIHVDGSSNSMGQAVSANAYIVMVNRFEDTQVNDVVHLWKWSANGRDEVLHQVSVKGAESLRTWGMNNAHPDINPVMRDQYKGTMVAQVYYRQ